MRIHTKQYDDMICAHIFTNIYVCKFVRLTSVCLPITGLRLITTEVRNAKSDGCDQNENAPLY